MIDKDNVGRQLDENIDDNLTLHSMIFIHYDSMLYITRTKYNNVIIYS